MYVIMNDWLDLQTRSIFVFIVAPDSTPASCPTMRFDHFSWLGIAHCMSSDDARALGLLLKVEELSIVGNKPSSNYMVYGIYCHLLFGIM